MPAITMPPRVRASIRHTLALYGVPEARHALAMLEAGRVDGGLYMDPNTECGCLIGTLTAARSPIPDCRFDGWMDEANPALGFLSFTGAYFNTVAAQDWFYPIRPGDTPTNSGHAALAADCIREWIAENTLDLAPTNPLLAPEATAQAIARLLREA